MAVFKRGNTSDDDWQKICSIVLTKYKESFEDGEKFVLLKAIEFCALEKVLVPDWLSHALHDHLNKLRYCEVASLDDAFGFEKITHLNKKRKDLKKRLPVYQSVLAAIDNGETTPDVFVSVGADHLISPSTARDYYYEVKKLLGDFEL